MDETGSVAATSCHKVAYMKKGKFDILFVCLHAYLDFKDRKSSGGITDKGKIVR